MKQFGCFQLDTRNECLWQNGTRIGLTPKPFAVLRYLVENPQRLVTHDELLDKLWPETYVQPQVLRTYVLELRKLLGDSVESPRFIRTVPGRGYWFLAQVEDDGGYAADSSAATWAQLDRHWAAAWALRGTAAGVRAAQRTATACHPGRSAGDLHHRGNRHWKNGVDRPVLPPTVQRRPGVYRARSVCGRVRRQGSLLSGDRSPGTALLAQRGQETCARDAAEGPELVCAARCAP